MSLDRVKFDILFGLIDRIDANSPIPILFPIVMQQTSTSHSPQPSFWQSSWVKLLGIYGGLSAIASLMLFPLLWLLSTALKSADENIFQSPPQLLPTQPTLDNIITVWQSNDFGRYLFNSSIIAILSVTINLIFCALAAYPLARLEFKGREIIFTIVVSTIVIPFQIVMIPLYIIAVQLGLINTYLGVILPNLASAFGIFLLRQAFQSVPKELEEAARMDGCWEIGIWWSVMLPAIRPALVTLSIFVFIGAWSDFLWPLIVLQEDTYYTLPLAVAKLAEGAFGLNWRLVAAGSVISIAPVLLLFIFVQRYIVPTAAGSGVKG
jgi:putative chitobiose transport system permease protein